MPPTNTAPTKLRVAITGSSGMVGSALVSSLTADGQRVDRVVRSRPSHGEEAVYWKPTEGVIEAHALEGCDAVVHLAGENIAQRWSAAAKRRIRDSRVDSTRLLVGALTRLKRRPSVLVSASALGIYGDRGDELLDEESELGNDFLAEVAKAWEAATRPAVQAGIRVVNTRFGIILSPSGGALEKLLTVFRLGAGGKAGSGEQWMSWVALTDVVRVIRFAIETGTLRGPVNVVAPNPVRNAEFAKTLGEVLHRPSFATVPRSMIKLVIGEMGEATILVSQRVRAAKLDAAGYAFRYQRLEEALRAEIAGES